MKHSMGSMDEAVKKIAPDCWLLAAIRLLPDAVVAVDSDGRVVGLNPKAEGLLGWGLEEALGRDGTEVMDVLDETGASTDPAPCGRLPDGGGPSGPDTRRVWVRRRDGSSILCQLETSVVREGGGEADGFLHTLQVSAEAGRTAEVDLQGMIARLSHELRTPLTSIKGCSSSLVRDFDRFNQQTKLDLLRIVDEQADRMRDLIEEVLDASRVESRDLRLECQSVALGRLVQQVADELRRRAHGHHFIVDLPPDLPLVQVDPPLIQQVLRNLLNNAVSYSTAGTRIWVRALVAEGMLQVCVEDEGVGVAPEDAERIFDQFYQTKGGRHRGLGLGLAICRGIVTAHGGRIWVEPVEAAVHDYGASEAGAVSGPGSHFCFTLPLAAGEETRPVPAGSATASASRSTPASKRSEEHRLPTILVVDDETRIRRLLEANLRVAGYRVLVAADGQGAVNAVATEGPDLVVLDILLPDLDGFEVCRRIREFSAVPIIILTARSDEADKVKGLDLGADDYLTKPFEPKELLARIRASLRRAELPEELRDHPVFVLGDFRMDFAQRRVAVRGRGVKLSPTEYKLLYHLVSNAGRVLTHDELLRRVWGSDYGSETEYLWQYVRRLRRKIEPDPQSPRYLLTESGVGYRFAGQA